MQPGRDRRIVTVSVMLGMFLAALEATAVAAAMPTAVGELGGLSRFSWVFSAYLLTSTTTGPMYGKLADLFGRRRVYMASVGIFLLGSALCGVAGSMTQLIVFRTIQGIGAGGVMPVGATIIGDIFTLEERGRMQGLFSGVWATASFVGPLLGGLLTDALSWRWIFYINLPFGIASAWLLHRSLRDEPERREHRLDVLGTVSLTAAVTLLLVALAEGGGAWGWGDPRTQALAAGAVASLAVFLWQERRAPEPMLPLDLFANRLIAVASVGNAILGALLFAMTAYVPMFAQAVLGGSAVDAGVVLAPVLIGWPISSTISGWLLLRVGYRTLAIGGWVLTVVGAVLLAGAGATTTRPEIMLAMLLVGLGLGFTSMPYFLGPQNAVPWSRRGVATSSIQFFRTIGGAVAVAALGALLTARVQALAGEGADPQAALDPGLRAGLSPGALERLVSALVDGLGAVYVALAVLAGAGLLVSLFFPGGTAASHVHRPEGAEGPAGGPEAAG